MEKRGLEESSWGKVGGEGVDIVDLLPGGGERPNSRRLWGEFTMELSGHWGRGLTDLVNMLGGVRGEERKNTLLPLPKKGGKKTHEKGEKQNSRG